jgi:hypothetical protein
MTTHIPAWKRLGLKLKYAKQEADPPARLATNGTHIHLNGHSHEDEPPRKKIRFRDDDDPDVNAKQSPSKSLGKKVSFTSDTKGHDGENDAPPIDASSITSTNPGPPSTNGILKQPIKPSRQKTSVGLDYLDQFFQNRGEWKFNKNRETWILKNATNLVAIPKEYNFKLACYICSLKSKDARQRLRNQVENSNQNHVNGDDGEQEEFSTPGVGFESMHDAIGCCLRNQDGLELVEGKIISWTNEQTREAMLMEALDALWSEAYATRLRGKGHAEMAEGVKKDTQMISVTTPSITSLAEPANDILAKRQRKSKIRSNIEISLSSESESSSSDEDSSEESSSSDASSEAESSSSSASEGEGGA